LFSNGYTGIKNGFLQGLDFWFSSDVGCSGFSLLGYLIVDESKLPLQEPKEKRVSMNEAGEEAKTGFLKMTDCLFES
jgi:hypothetical protein